MKPQTRDATLIEHGDGFAVVRESEHKAKAEEHVASITSKPPNPQYSPAAKPSSPCRQEARR